MQQESLELLEKDYWGAPPSEATYLVRTVHQLRSKPLDSLTPEDLRIMISQEVGTVHLVPLALRILATDPLVEGDFYPGDLLVSVLRVDERYWATHVAELRTIKQIVAELSDADPPVANAVQLFLDSLK